MIMLKSFPCNLRTYDDNMYIAHLLSELYHKNCSCLKFGNRNVIQFKNIKFQKFQNKAFHGDTDFSCFKLCKQLLEIFPNTKYLHHQKFKYVEEDILRKKYDGLNRTSTLDRVVRVCGGRREYNMSF